MRRWFGPQVDRWRHLRTYWIPEALPPASPTDKPQWISHPKLHHGLYRAGDAWNSPSLNGALASGRLAAEAIVHDLNQHT
jgi:predicted NAD/FAD-dependent oxidoreductase